MQGTQLLLQILVVLLHVLSLCRIKPKFNFIIISHYFMTKVNRLFSISVEETINILIMYVDCMLINRLIKKFKWPTFCVILGKSEKCIWSLLSSLWLKNCLWRINDISILFLWKLWTNIKSTFSSILCNAKTKNWCPFHFLFNSMVE